MEAAPGFRSGRTRECCIGASQQGRPPVTTLGSFWSRLSAFPIFANVAHAVCRSMSCDRAAVKLRGCRDVLVGRGDMEGERLDRR